MKRFTQPGEKHCAASVYILTREEPKRVLLVHHNKFKKWLAPGGHVEQEENPYEAAIREVREETGLDIAAHLPPLVDIDGSARYLPLPTYFLEEDIPAFGNTPAHVHIDFIYTVEIPHAEVVHDANESLGIGWFTYDEMLELETFEDVRTSLKELLGR